MKKYTKINIEKMKKTAIQLFNRENNLAIFDEKIEIRERCKGVHCVDLGESFTTRIYLQKSASIQPRTSPSKFGGKIQYNIRFTPYPSVAPPPAAIFRKTSSWYSGASATKCEMEAARASESRKLKTVQTFCKAALIFPVTVAKSDLSEHVLLVGLQRVALRLVFFILGYH